MFAYVADITSDEDRSACLWSREYFFRFPTNEFGNRSSLQTCNMNIDISYLNDFTIHIQGGHGTGKTGNLVLTFSRQGKHREFSFDTGKIFFFVTQGKF